MNLSFSIKKRAVKLAQTALLPFVAVITNKLKQQEGFTFTSIHPEDGFERLHASEAKRISPGVQENALYPAGKTIAFSTDSNKLVFLIAYSKRELFENMDSQASSGVDLYGETPEGKLVWICCISPENSVALWATKSITCSKLFSKYIAFLPSYAAISNIEIGVPDEKHIKNDSKSKETCVLFYGSSITQGCSASRPGLNYVNRLAIELGFKACNFGFSSSAKGEQMMIDLIAKKHAEIYVIEYDHNASLCELENTHLNAYKTIRSFNPHSLIILMSRTSGGLSIPEDEFEKREAIILNTLESGLKAGDRNLCFISGKTMLPTDKSCFFVDNKHPNDKGMEHIANHLSRAINERLKH